MVKFNTFVKQLVTPIIALALISIGDYTWADWTVNMPRGVTPISRDIYDLHMAIFWICVVIGVIVFGVLIYTLIFHRKSRGAVAANFHEHPILEVIWAVVPFIILVIMAIPASRVLIAMDDNSAADITIKVTGYQWKWQYDYLDENIGFFSNLATPIEEIKNAQKKNPWYLLEVDNPVVVPINKKIRFLVTAHDVIHSWWVPALGIKRDGIPGFIHESWARIETPGTYRGQCAELCGVNHAYMPIVVQAMTESDYQAWLLEQKRKQLEETATHAKAWTKEELMDRGEHVYNQFCSVCHKADGLGMPPVYPSLKASSIVVSERVDRHIDIVLNGVSGTAMQAFAKQLSDADLAAVITYERNAWDNNTGDLVQPIDIKRMRLQH